MGGTPRQKPSWDLALKRLVDPPLNPADLWQMLHDSAKHYSNQQLQAACQHASSVPDMSYFDDLKLVACFVALSF